MHQERAKALEHIDQIKSHLIDKQAFYPYNYNAIYVWSSVAVILTFVMIPAYEESQLLGSGVLFALISLGFVVEGLMTKRVNASYDIDDCTSRQRFIMKNFLMLCLFLLVLSATLASYRLYIPIYLSWIFLISIGYFAVGYVINIPHFSHMAQLNIAVSMLLFVMGSYMGHLVGDSSLCIYLVQLYTIVGLSLFPAIIAYRQKRANV
jgi:hypothetical protein